ncbi:MAG: glycosyltransferase family 39 protein [Calditrichaeota bacterium]|nr:glycosyltransferase family 39 protein [Candidatus Cloacimonadota bacterium]MCB1047198.1 glycosyltransferase family 39 protein [Calditrichota bacterium]MCB9474602.1 glycosyltransferase family 39 protein [Candidatus Delongbacteria bacterium]
MKLDWRRLSTPGYPVRVLALFLLMAAALMSGLQQKGFWGAHGESRRAEVARELVSHDRWLVPTLLDEPFITKPPLAYWTMAASMRVFGISELAARVPAMLSVLLALLLVADAGRRLGGLEHGVRAASAFLALPLVLGMGQQAETEAQLLFWITLGLWAWLGLESRSGQWPRRMLLAVALCGGFMVKGPLIWIFLLPAFAVGEFWSTPRLSWRDFLLWVVFALLLVLPWFLLVAQRVPGALDVWLGESVARVSDPDFSVHREPFWYYLPNLVVFLPWLPLLAVAWPPGQRLRQQRTHAWRALLPALLLPLLILSLASSKRAHYLLGLAPVVALLVADSGPWSLVAGWRRHGLWITRTVLVLVPLALMAVIVRLDGLQALPWAILLLSVALFAARTARLLPDGALVVALCYILAGQTLLPTIDAYRNPGPFYLDAGQRVSASSEPGLPVLNWKNDRYSASFQLRRPVRPVATEEALREAAPEGAWLLMQAKDAPALPGSWQRIHAQEFQDPLLPGRQRTWWLVRWSPQSPDTTSSRNDDE